MLGFSINTKSFVSPACTGSPFCIDATQKCFWTCHSSRSRSNSNSYVWQCNDSPLLHPYEDAGLLQTSQLDSHSEKLSSNTKAREDFLRWLVDCHKASFIPMCLAGKDNILTREAATVVEMTKEGDFSIPVSSSTKRGNAMLRRLSGRITPLNKPSGGNNILDDFETGLN